MRLCVHSSKPYVFLSLSSQSGLEAVDQCVVTNAGMRSGKEVACGLLSQIHVTRWFVCSRKKGRLTLGGVQSVMGKLLNSLRIKTQFLEGLQSVSLRIFWTSQMCMVWPLLWLSAYVALFPWFFLASFWFIGYRAISKLPLSRCPPEAFIAWCTLAYLTLMKHTDLSYGICLLCPKYLYPVQFTSKVHVIQVKTMP